MSIICKSCGLRKERRRMRYEKGKGAKIHIQRSLKGSKAIP